MPKRTPISEPCMTWRTRHIPVSLVERVRELAFLLNTTEEDIVNEALGYGLDYMDGNTSRLMYDPT